MILFFFGGVGFDLRIELNSWPERLMLLIKVNLRTEQKCKEFTRRPRASEHPLTPFPGVSWKQRKIKRGTIQKGFHAFLCKSEWLKLTWRKDQLPVNQLTDLTVVEKAFPRNFCHPPLIVITMGILDETAETTALVYE